MKKLILSLVTLSTFAFSKQFAYCIPTVTLDPSKFDYCGQVTSTGKKNLKLYSAGQMYANGWRLITVSNYITNGTLYAYFYFEK